MFGKDMVAPANANSFADMLFEILSNSFPARELDESVAPSGWAPLTDAPIAHVLSSLVEWHRTTTLLALKSFCHAGW